tara:strand:- start:1805 stop:3400 length:1596 start_codon:yes stop_codon:yes gene_type:complete
MKDKSQHDERVREVVSKLRNVQKALSGKGDVTNVIMHAIGNENLTKDQQRAAAVELVGSVATEQWFKENEIKAHEATEGKFNTKSPASALASGQEKRTCHSQFIFDDALIELDKFKTFPRNFEKLGISGTNVANKYSLSILNQNYIIPYVDSLVKAYCSVPDFEAHEDWMRQTGLNNETDGHARVTTHESLELLKYWAALKAEERNVTVRIDESHARRMDEVSIDPKIAKQDWKKQFFHLSDAYTIEFGNKYSFLLTFSSPKESDYFNINYKFLRKLVLDAIDLYSKAADSNPQSEGAVAYSKIPKEKREGFNRFAMQQLRSKFSSSLHFLYEEKIPDSKYKERGGMIGWLYFNSYEDFEVLINRGKREDSRIEGSILNKLLMCLSLLNFSHKREFVTNNKSLTINQRKAAKGLPLKKEKASYKELTSEKIIDIPRKEYFNSMRTTGKGGTHASPKGHDRNQYSRTYRHEKYAASGLQGKTVMVGSEDGIKVNGGAQQHQKIIYNVNPKSEMVEDFISELEKNKTFPETEK